MMNHQVITRLPSKILFFAGCSSGRHSPSALPQRVEKISAPHVSLEIPVSGELPVVESTLQVTVPKDEPFHFALENVPDSVAVRGAPINPDPAIKQAALELAIPGNSQTWWATVGRFSRRPVEYSANDLDLS